MKLSEQQLEAAKRRLQKESAICAAFLHGSAVQGCLRPDSDVDISLLLKPHMNIPPQHRLSLTGELESLFGRPVDLGILSTNNLVYAKEVIKQGQELFTENSFFSERFFSVCLSMYADLQQDRKEVLHAYSA